MTWLFLAIVLLILRMLLMRVRMVLGIVRLGMVGLWQRLSVLRLMLMALSLIARRVHRFPALILALERLLCLDRLRRTMRRGGKVVVVYWWRLCNWVQLVLSRLGLVRALMCTGHSV
jgi:hypothetical protein